MQFHIYNGLKYDFVFKMNLRNELHSRFNSLYVVI